MHLGIYKTRNKLYSFYNERFFNNAKVEFITLMLTIKAIVLEKVHLTTY